MSAIKKLKIHYYISIDGTVLGPPQVKKCLELYYFTLSAVILSKALQTVSTLDSISAFEIDAHLRDNSVFALTP